MWDVFLHLYNVPFFDRKKSTSFKVCWKSGWECGWNTKPGAEGGYSHWSQDRIQWQLGHIQVCLFFKFDIWCLYSYLLPLAYIHHTITKLYFGWKKMASSFLHISRHWRIQGLVLISFALCLQRPSQYCLILFTKELCIS